MVGCGQNIVLGQRNDVRSTVDIGDDEAAGQHAHALDGRGFMTIIMIRPRGGSHPTADASRHQKGSCQQRKRPLVGKRRAGELLATSATS